MTNPLSLPVIDVSGYINPRSEQDKQQVIAQVKDACAQYGFFQMAGHGVPMSVQEGLWRALGNFFHQPKEKKMKQSFLNDRCRRGYESSGDSLRDGDPLPDSKEVREEPPRLSLPATHAKAVPVILHRPRGSRL